MRKREDDQNELDTTATQKIRFIYNHIKDTHNEQDLYDLYKFSEEEINDIYNELIESNK